MKKFKSYLVILSGVILLSASISLFCVPNRIVSGGVSGISTILFYLFKIPVGVSYYALNILFLAAGFKLLGKAFIIKTLICSGLVSVFSDIFAHLPPLTNDVVLASVFGGVLGGLGIGMTLIENASTGGTDVASRIVQSKFEYIPIGRLLMAIDAVIIGASFFLFGDVSLALYGALSLFISTTSIDMLINKMNVSKLVFIVTVKGNDIVDRLIKRSVRGATVLHAEGAYTGEGKTLLVCALKEYELPPFQKKILELDRNAFIVFCESQQIIGNGFHVYH